MLSKIKKKDNKKEKQITILPVIMNAREAMKSMGSFSIAAAVTLCGSTTTY